MKIPDFEPSKEILSGETADIYFSHTLKILEAENLNPTATMEFFPTRPGIFCGIHEVKALINKVLPAGATAWALTEGATMEYKEVALRITAPYLSYGLYETAIDGILSSCSGWATAARECADAAGEIPCISFGARHIHPEIAGRMDYAAIIGGCKGCSTTSGAKLAGIEPSGTMPHAMILIIGDTVKTALSFDARMPAGIPRITLVDTFQDEAVESLRVAEALGDKLASVRLDTPGERGGVTPALVKEVRARLDLAGFSHVGIFVSGGITPERILTFIESGTPVSGFGIGSYISGATPIDFTADIHEIEGRPVAKRGRIPGVTANSRLQQLI